MQKDLIFREICEHGTSADHFDKRCLNAFLQANGVCFPAHLTEAFFRRFNFSKEDTISFVQFSELVLFEPVTVSPP